MFKLNRGDAAPLKADGLFLCGRIPGAGDADALIRSALEAGIFLAKGQMFSLSGQFEDYFRFNVAHSSDPRLGVFLARASAQGVAGTNVRQLRPASSSA